MHWLIKPSSSGFGFPLQNFHFQCITGLDPIQPWSNTPSCCHGDWRSAHSETSQLILVGWGAEGAPSGPDLRHQVALSRMKAQSLRSMLAGAVLSAQ